MVKNCISLSKMTVGETLPIIGACEICISNDTGFAHISAALGFKMFNAFYGFTSFSLWDLIVKIFQLLFLREKLLKAVDTIQMVKDKISFDKVLSKTLNMLELTC